MLRFARCRGRWPDFSAPGRKSRVDSGNTKEYGQRCFARFVPPFWLLLGVLRNGEIAARLATTSPADTGSWDAIVSVIPS
jgi:hypothetical protein